MTPTGTEWTMSDVAIIVILAVIALLALLVLPDLLTRRAIPSVLRTFREHSATGISSAKTMDELGLSSRTMIERLTKPRDYRLRALQFLIRVNIIQVTEDGKLYLSEDNLAATKWKRR